MKKVPKMKAWVAVSLSVVVILGTGAGVAVGLEKLAPARVWIEGRPVPSEPAALGAMIDESRKLATHRELDVFTGSGFVTMELGDLGVEIDVGATLRAARSAQPSISTRLSQAWILARGGWAPPIEIDYVWRVDHEKAKAALEAFAPEVRREPINAKLDLVHHQRIDDIPGEELDPAVTASLLDSLSNQGGDILHLAKRVVPAAITTDAIGRIEVNKVLSSYETTFATYGVGVGRSANIANAARHIDGTILAPGETFSYNEVVGPRTEERGFTHAPEIVGDELQDGIGGGVCQVASTLYAASMFGALEVVERFPHGRPSAYTLLGLDATVAYGKVDLKIRNNTSYPVVLHVYLPKPNMVRAEILGGEPRAKVEYRYAVGRTSDFFRRITYKPFLPHGKVVQRQKGHRGSSVFSQVLTHWFDGREEERTYYSEYRPVPEVFWVGPGFEEETLPEMPEGAKRVERKGLPKPTNVTVSTPTSSATSSSSGTTSG